MHKSNKSVCEKINSFLNFKKAFKSIYRFVTLWVSLKVIPIVLMSWKRKCSFEMLGDVFWIGTGFLRIAAVILHKRSDCWIEHKRASIKQFSRSRSWKRQFCCVSPWIYCLVWADLGWLRCNSLQKTLNNRSNCWIGNSKSQWTCLPFITTSIYFGSGESLLFSSNRTNWTFLSSCGLNQNKTLGKSSLYRSTGIEKTLYLLAM